MGQVPSSIAVSQSGTTLLNAMQVTTTAGSVLNEVVTLGDYASSNVATVLAEGALLIEPGGTNTQPVSGTFFPPTQTVTGTVAIVGAITVTDPANGATGSAVPATAVFNGLQIATSYPTAGTNTALVGMMSDKAGRAAVVLNSVRDLAATASLQATTTAATQLIAAGGSGVFQDITTLIITNSMTSNATLSLVDTGPPTTYTFNIAPYGGIAQNFPTPLKQGSSNASWTAALAAAGTMSVITIYVSNK